MVSVIVPAYNAEEFLEQAVKSVFAQTMPDWELILVDDGSTDSTPLLCETIADASPQTRVVHRPNGGLSEARNSGIDVARGDYLYFLDADDMMHPQSLEILTAAIDAYNADIAIGKFRKFASSESDAIFLSSHDFSLSQSSIHLLSSDAAIEDALYQRIVDHSAWGKLYSAHLFSDLRFTPSIGYEDLDLFYMLWEGAQRIVSVDVPLYLYRQHQKSYLHNFSLRRADVLDVTRRIEEWCRRERPALLPAARDRRFSANFNIFNLIHQNGNEYPELADECWQIIRQYRREALLNPRVRLKNKLGALISLLGKNLTARVAKIYK